MNKVALAPWATAARRWVVAAPMVTDATPPREDRRVGLGRSAGSVRTCAAPRSCSRQ